MPATFPTTLDHDYLSASLFFLQLLLLSNKLKLRNLKTSKVPCRRQVWITFTHMEKNPLQPEKILIYVFTLLVETLHIQLLLTLNIKGKKIQGFD